MYLFRVKPFWLQDLHLPSALGASFSKKIGCGMPCLLAFAWFLVCMCMQQSLSYTFRQHSRSHPGCTPSNATLLSAIYLDLRFSICHCRTWPLLLIAIMQLDGWGLISLLWTVTFLYITAAFLDSISYHTVRVFGLDFSLQRGCSLPHA